MASHPGPPTPASSPRRQVTHYLLGHLGVSDPFQAFAMFVREKLLLVAPTVSGTGGGPAEPAEPAAAPLKED